MTNRNFTQSQFQSRISELITNGKSPKVAKKIAQRERRNAHPQHKAAVARRLASADDRFNATGNLDAYKAVQS